MQYSTVQCSTVQYNAVQYSYLRVQRHLCSAAYLLGRGQLKETPAIRWDCQVCTVHCTALHYTARHCTALHCTALHCTALHCTALHCTALHCTALHCTARYVVYSSCNVEYSSGGGDGTVRNGTFLLLSAVRMTLFIWPTRALTRLGSHWLPCPNTARHHCKTV